MRTNIPEADKILDLYFPMLDGNGFIALKDYMGGDQSIVQAARNSYAKGTKKVSDDRTLIRHLIRSGHTSPIEFVELQFHIRAPLYVIQQWLRHRTSNFCAESHRFSEVKDDFQKTDSSLWRLQSKDNKQGSSGYLSEWPEGHTAKDREWNIGYDNLSQQTVGQYLSNVENSIHDELSKRYKERLELGVAREQARKDIPHSTYSSLYVKSDLHNLLHFITLRCDSHAQEEIRMYANFIAGVIKRVAPITYEAWLDYKFCAKNFTRLDLEFLNYLTKYWKFTDWDDLKRKYEMFSSTHHLDIIGLSKREYKEFWEKLIPTEIPNFDLDISKAVEKK